MTVYYADPTGTNPRTVAAGIALLTPGDTLLLKDGVYTGASGMVQTSALHGALGSRITIGAQNPGNVLIDGEFTNSPIRALNSSHLTIQDLYARRSSGSIVTLTNSVLTDTRNEVKRVAAWDVPNNGNYHAFLSYYQQNALFEECIGFGRARYVYHPYRSDSVTFRRCWGRWNGSPVHTGPKATMKAMYNSSNILWENCIAEWDYKTGVENNDYGHWSLGEELTPPVTGGTTRIYGCLAILRASDIFNAGYLFFCDDDWTLKVDMRHTVAYIGKTASGIRPFWLYGVGPATADHITSICGSGGALPAVEPASWTVTNHLIQQLVGSYDLYDNLSSGAKIRHRYVNGALTSGELWPWPMTARIKAALNLGGYDTDYDLDTAIQSIFGPYPAGGVTTLATTSEPATDPPTTVLPTTLAPSPTTTVPTTVVTTPSPTTVITTPTPTTSPATTVVPTTPSPTTLPPTTLSPATTLSPSPTTANPPTTLSPTSNITTPAPTTAPPPLPMGTVCWGHDTGVAELNIRNFAGNWVGTALISGLGDTEILTFDALEVEESETWHIGPGRIKITIDKYGSGSGSPTVRYKNGATQIACEADVWHAYVGSFVCAGWVKVRLEHG